MLHPGNTLVVPASATNPGATAAPAESAAAPATSTYTVQSGDYLFGIARNYNIKLGTLLKLNNLTVNSAVHPGTQLVIPAGAVAVSTAPANKASGGLAVLARSRQDRRRRRLCQGAAGQALPVQLGGPRGVRLFGSRRPRPTPRSACGCHTRARCSRPAVSRWTGGRKTSRPATWSSCSRRRHPTVISHLGIAINSWQWIHAPRSGDVVRIGLIPNDNVIQAVRRYVTD